MPLILGLGQFGAPRVISSLPSGVSWRTVLSPLSTQQHRDRPGAMVTPWGLLKTPSPHALKTFPSESKTTMGQVPRLNT